MVISIYVLLLSLLCKILEVRESNKELVSTIKKKGSITTIKASVGDIIRVELF